VAIELPDLRLVSLAAGADPDGADPGEGTGEDSFLAKFDLSAMMFEAGDRLAGSVEYRRELFDRSTIERLAAMFVRLLEDLSDDPSARISELSLLGPAERHQLVHEWGRSLVPPDPVVAPGPRRISALEAILAHAAERPDAPAVVAADDAVLTYGQLVARSAALARYLAPFVGGHPEPLVAVLAERSPEEVVADLAAWRLGGAYLPLDPAHPDERQRMVLDDSRAPVVVLGSSAAVDPGLAQRLAAPGRTVVALAELDLDVEAEASAAELLTRPVDLHSAAYCFYTSGSTGRPKGVMVSHLALAGIVDWYVTDYPPQPGDRMGHVASPAFDPTVFDLWPALATGGTVVSVDDDTRRDPARLLERLALSGVRYVLCPTPIAEALMDLDDFSVARGRPLRGIMSGGDQLRRRPKPQVPFELIDVYGPVEAAVVATTGVVEEVPRRPGEQPSIGRPRPGCTARALDRWLRPAPPGVAGELVLGGDCLARGYLDQPARTAAVFVPDPFSPRPGQRLYRTGDRVRFHADGRFDFLGRLDRQVKVRGVRVEPGEVEGALAGHPDLAEVAVVAVAARRGGEKVLAAYLVAQAGADPALLEPAALAGWASTRLPAALVPSLWTVLPELPKTATGKVDRRALPEPTQALDTGYRPPRTETEKAVAEIWRRVLEVERVGLDDDFFALGGHSLLATRVVAEMREAFDREVELRLLFERPTVAGLADHLVSEELAHELAVGEVDDDELERLLAELEMATGPDDGGDEA
jgi:amino acid adenylation domain-containing protein